MSRNVITTLQESISLAASLCSTVRHWKPSWPYSIHLSPFQYISLLFILILSSHLRIRVPSSHLRTNFPIVIPRAFYLRPLPVRTTCAAHRNLSHFTTLTMLNGPYKSQTSPSLRNIENSTSTFCPYIFLSTWCSNIYLGFTNIRNELGLQTFLAQFSISHIFAQLNAECTLRFF